MKPLYTAVATAIGGREGHVTSSDKLLDIDVRPPKELGGMGGATNPEQLFAAGYAACFEGAMQVVGRSTKVSVSGLSVTARVTFNKNEGTPPYRLSVELHGKSSELSKEQLTSLMTAAHQICPYSDATRGNIEVKLVAE